MLYKFSAITVLALFSVTTFAQQAAQTEKSACSGHYETAARNEPGKFARFFLDLLANAVIQGDADDDSIEIPIVFDHGGSVKKSYAILEQAVAAKRESAQAVKDSELDKFLTSALKDKKLRSLSRDRAIDLLVRSYDSVDPQISLCSGDEILAHKSLKTWLKAQVSQDVAGQAGAKVSQSKSKSSESSEAVAAKAKASSGGGAI